MAVDAPPLPAAQATAPTVPFELRLRALEARVLGVPSSQLLAPSAESEPLARRLQAVSERVEAAVGSSSSLKQFSERYDTYAPLLHGGPSDKESGVTLADVVPDETKVAIVVEARDDIKDAERGLREIEVLAARGVAGAGELDDLVKLKPALDKGRSQLSSRQEKLSLDRKDVAALVERYNGFTSTVSDMFVALHDQVSALEEAVARAERKNKAELAERY